MVVALHGLVSSLGFLLQTLRPIEDQDASFKVIVPWPALVVCFPYLCDCRLFVSGLWPKHRWTECHCPFCRLYHSKHKHYHRRWPRSVLSKLHGSSSRRMPSHRQRNHQPPLKHIYRSLASKRNKQFMERSLPKHRRRRAKRMRRLRQHSLHDQPRLRGDRR